MILRKSVKGASPGDQGGILGKGTLGKVHLLFFLLLKFLIICYSWCGFQNMELIQDYLNTLNYICISDILKSTEDWFCLCEKFGKSG